MSKIEVKNTICFDFGDGCPRPTLAEMVNFVRMLEINADDIEAVYRISEEKAVFIKCKTEEAMLNALKNNNDELDFKYVDGKVVKVRMSPAGGVIQYVRIYDLPPELPDRELVAVLGIYGKVKRVVREKFPAEFGLNVHTGVRGAYMDVRKEIPPSLIFANRKGNIFHDGLKNKCFLCKFEGHHMNTCPKRKTLKHSEQRSRNDENHQEVERSCPTYAGVVTGDAPEENDQDKTEEIVSEEVMETEVILEAEASIENVTVTSEPAKQQRVIRVRNEEKYKEALAQWKEQQKRYAEEDKLLAAEKQRKKELRAQKKGNMNGNSPPRKNQKNSSIVFSDIMSE